jgi:hypothetical protein
MWSSIQSIPKVPLSTKSLKFTKWSHNPRTPYLPWSSRPSVCEPGRPLSQSHQACNSCSTFRSLVFQARIYIRQACQSNLDVSCSARPYLHMPGLPNPTSCELCWICRTTPVCTEHQAIWENLPGGAHQGRTQCWYCERWSCFVLPSTYLAY